MLSLVSHIQLDLHAVAQIILLLVLRSALAIRMAGMYAGKHQIKTKSNSSIVSAILICKSEQIVLFLVLGSYLELKRTQQQMRLFGFVCSYYCCLNDVN